LNGTDIAIFGS